MKMSAGRCAKLLRYIAKPQTVRMQFGGIWSAAIRIKVVKLSALVFFAFIIISTGLSFPVCWFLNVFEVWLPTCVAAARISILLISQNVHNTPEQWQPIGILTKWYFDYEIMAAARRRSTRCGTLNLYPFHLCTLYRSRQQRQQQNVGHSGCRKGFEWNVIHSMKLGFFLLCFVWW